MAGSNVYDHIINGSFDAVGAPPSYITPAYRAEDYASIYARPSTPTYQPGMMGRGQPSVGSPYLTASEKAKLEQQIATSKALQATMGQTPTAVASIPLPRIRPGNAPSVMDIAAINANGGVGSSLDDLLAYTQGLPDKKLTPAVLAANDLADPVTKVTAPLTAQPKGGLLDMLFGPSKNGMGGLAGLLGGPNAGGLFGMIAQPKTAAPPAYVPTGATGVGTNGYIYQNGQKVGVDPRYAGLTPAQRDALISSSSKVSKQDALIARANGSASSAENQAWREKTYGGSGGSLL